jgi:predicted nucleic acid-binding protein
MTRAVLADSGPLYAPNDECDEHFRRANRDLMRLDRERVEILVAYPILLETYSLLMFRLGLQAASGWLVEMTAIRYVNPAPEDYSRAATTVQALPDQRITLVDATLAAVALRLGLEVWTYDHHFDVMRIPVWR